MYRDELAMIQGKAVLDGNDADVKALAYDKERDLLHVASAWGRSTFRNLERVSSAATTVGVPASLSASNGALIMGGSTGLDVSLPAVSIRERLAQALPKAARLTEDFYFTGATDETTFALPTGWKPKRVHVDKDKMRPGSAEDYTVAFDGFVYSVVFNVAPVAAAEIDVEAMAV